MMTTTTGVPVMIDADVADLIAEKKLQTVLDKILEFAAQTFPDLLRIQVKFAPGYEEGEEPRAIIEPVSFTDFDWDDAAMRRFMDWVVANISPHDWLYFGVWREYEPADGR
jgi:hypothetical protein